MTEARIAVAITYHFVHAARHSCFRLRAHERPARFSEQLEHLGKNFEFLRCAELFERDLESSRHHVLITFDDGARDVYRDALPLLKRYDATATAFICSKPYLEGRLLQIQKVEFLMSKLGLNGFRKAFYDELERQFPGDIERESLDFAGGYRFYRYDDEPIRRFKLDLNYRLPYANVDPVLDALFENVFGPGSEAEAVRETYLGLDEIKRLVDAGIEIGVHTDSHRVMPRLDFAEQKREMETSAEFLKDITGRSEISVAYPFGFHNANTRKAAAEIGLQAGLVGGRRWIGPEDIRDRWTIPRFDVNDCFDRSTNQPLKSVLPGAALDPTKG